MISPLAHISQGAKIGENCTIEPFVYIEDNVVIGDNCHIMAHASILSGTRMGKNNRIFHGAVVGGIPQDLKFVGEDTTLEIGDNNTIRENVTMNRGTASKGKTVIGSNNLFMENCHIGHDSVIGSGCIIGNSTKIAGEVVISDFAILSACVLVHQFTHISSYVMIQGGTGITKDVPPYIIAGREPARYCGLNIVGLRRRGFSNEAIKSIRDAYRHIYESNTIVSTAVERIKESGNITPEVEKILHFIEKESERGIIA
ncbi:MAG: acyl-ACP--UDP-N-acetylglucosamine O-acyltransferase [Bacteroidaceae bacterium]|nr:acyl-ACP--UDP-N-acetylglucosamine O-acyltransferase [Bacteroidaceae bacterium]